jgi:hypothetical protein
VVPVLVLGPDGYDDRERVWQALDLFTIRDEAIEVLLLGERWPGEESVTRFAFEWAERHWWPRRIADPVHFGAGLKGLAKAGEDLLREVRGGKALVFHDGDRRSKYLDLYEQAREVCGARNYRLIEI